MMKMIESMYLKLCYWSVVRGGYLFDKFDTTLCWYQKKCYAINIYLEHIWFLRQGGNKFNHLIRKCIEFQAIIDGILYWIGNSWREIQLSNLNW